MGAAFDRNLEQPTGHAFAGSAGVREMAEQAGEVRNITQPAGEGRRERLFLQFHDGDGNRARGVLNCIVQPGKFI